MLTTRMPIEAKCTLREERKMPVLYGEIREEKAGQCKQYEQKRNEYLCGFLVRSYGLACAFKDW